MSLILFNKPFGVMSQFSDHATRATLGRYLKLPGIYPAGRLDADSEGLMLLTDDGRLQHQISHPDHGKLKTYLVQVEGLVQTAQLHTLRQPLDLGDFITRGSRTVRIAPPDWLWPRDPPVRERSHIPTSWLAITISEGKNRQVRRMTAAAGLPTLRLVRTAIGPFSLSSHPLLPGEWRVVTEQEWQAPANQR
ncbi:MAG: pseudouridine synthase [Oxalobacteraceae bacterium]